jgi:DNA anti-recombination protein RmuC
MGLGSTAKKLQKVVDAAEQLYAKMNEVIQRLTTLEEEVETTSRQVDVLERELAEQRALLDAVAETEGIDVEETLAAADLPEPAAEDSSVDEADAGTETAS